MNDDIKVGDRFEITVEVTSLGSSTAGVATAGAPPQGSEPTRAIFWKTELLAGRRLPRSIKVGDEVRLPGGTTAIVICLDGDDAWLLFSNKSHSSWPLSCLTLANGET